DKLSHRLSPAATGLVQSTLGNLPELFLAIFALQAGLLGVVAAALVGSVLGNALFVLGLALVVGGLRHGELHFSKTANNLYATILLLGVAALIVPFLAVQIGEPDFGHAVDRHERGIRGSHRDRAGRQRGRESGGGPPRLPEPRRPISIARPELGAAGGAVPGAAGPAPQLLRRAGAADARLHAAAAGRA